MPAAPRLVLVDGSSYFYRAFFAIRGLRNSKGVPTNAIYGFTAMVHRVLRECDPTHMAVVFDAWAPTFRTELFPAYKANRPGMPEDLAAQIPTIKKVPPLYGLFTVEQAGFEADDIIGTIARRAEREKCEVVIITADKDLMQLVTRKADERDRPGVLIFDDRTERWIGEGEVREKFGVPPDRVPDALGLIGDASDNIPGVKGIGPKFAADLLAKWQSLDRLLDNSDGVEPARFRDPLRLQRDQALLSRKLATIVTDLALSWSLDDLKRKPPDRDALVALFRELEFTRFLREAEGAAPAAAQTLSSDGYRAILDADELESVARELRDAGAFAVDVETDSTDSSRAKLAGIALCAHPGRAYYVPVAHHYLGAPEQIPLARIRKILDPLLADPKLAKIGQNIKYDLVVLRRHGFDIAGVAFDTMIASYLLDPEATSHALDALAERHLQHRMIAFEEVVGKGKEQVTFDLVPVERATPYSAGDADVTLRLWPILRDRLPGDGLDKLFADVEMPLVEVLADMEMAGVKIDARQLAKLSETFARRAEGLTKEIYRLAGREFNLDSPKQLQEVLFRDLGLSPGRQTKTGLSTDAATLEKLAAEHPVPAKLLEYRHVTKLRSTYLEALPKLVNPETGRVHTSYNQAVAATGRLSSSDPNLQNIPIRGEDGPEIRRAFIAEKGHVLVSADYSQVELRILAHLSGDEGLRAAFRDGKDIHAATAAEIFGVAPELVAPDMRRKAKEINFGIIYGLSPHGLSQRLGIPHGAAEEIVERYFGRYPGVRRYLDGVLEKARAEGSVRTLLNRRRFVRDLESKNRAVRQAAERIAVNTPIQGTAADLIKLAMIRVARRLRAELPKARLTLQVHDELVVEVPKAQAKRAAELLRREMAAAHPLDVPVVVDVGIGPNWTEAH